MGCVPERAGPGVTRSLGWKSPVGIEPQRGSTPHHPAFWAVLESPPTVLFVLEIKGMWFRFLSGQACGSSMFPSIAGVGRGWGVDWGSLAGLPGREGGLCHLRGLQTRETWCEMLVSTIGLSSLFFSQPQAPRRDRIPKSYSPNWKHRALKDLLASIVHSS